MNILFIIFGVSMVGAVIYWLGWSQGCAYQKTKCKKCSAKGLEQELEYSAKILLRVTDEIGVISGLQCEKECAEALRQEIHDMFFFREFKYPEKIKRHLESRRDSLKRQTYDKAEAQKKAAMYDKLLEELRPEWTENEEKRQS